MSMSAIIKRRPTQRVQVGKVMLGGGAPIVVQSMTNTDTADAAATAQQGFDLAKAGSELVRIPKPPRKLQPYAHAWTVWVAMCLWLVISITTVIGF